MDAPGKILVEKGIAEGARISVISKIELLSWNPPSGSKMDNIQSFVHDSIVFGLDEAIIENTIHLRKKSRRIKLPDAIIAATALCFNLNLITRDISDFYGISGLALIDPFNV